MIRQSKLAGPSVKIFCNTILFWKEFVKKIRLLNVGFLRRALDFKMLNSYNDKKNYVSIFGKVATNNILKKPDTSNNFA